MKSFAYVLGGEAYFVWMCSGNVFATSLPRSTCVPFFPPVKCGAWNSFFQIPQWESGNITHSQKWSCNRRFRLYECTFGRRSVYACDWISDLSAFFYVHVSVPLLWVFHSNVFWFFRLGDWPTSSCRTLTDPNQIHTFQFPNSIQKKFLAPYRLLVTFLTVHFSVDAVLQWSVYHEYIWSSWASIDNFCWLEAIQTQNVCIHRAVKQLWVCVQLWHYISEEGWSIICVHKERPLLREGCTHTEVSRWWMSVRSPSV